MINAKELRLGNFINYINSDYINDHKKRDDTFEVIEVDVIDHLGINNFAHEDLEGIPLTHELLHIHLGFEFSAYKIFKGYGRGLTNGKITVDCNTMQPTDFGNNISATEIKYLHQLQNLYFALTGEELTYTP